MTNTTQDLASMSTGPYRSEYNVTVITDEVQGFYCGTALPGVHEWRALKKERCGKCPRVNEIFILLALSSGYTIFKP